jgi:hypothetical protein
MQMKIHLNPFSKVSLKKEDSLIILAQQDLSLADTGPFCTYIIRETFKDPQKCKSNVNQTPCYGYKLESLKFFMIH